MPLKDPEARRAWEREYRKRPEVGKRKRENARRWHAEKRAEGDGAYRRMTLGYYLKWQYGITLDEYEDRLRAQEGTCAICKTADPSPRERFSVDHNHATGAVRGLLCHACNSVLGLAGDEVDRLRRAIDYLERAR